MTGPTLSIPFNLRRHNDRPASSRVSGYAGRLSGAARFSCASLEHSTLFEKHYTPAGEGGDNYAPNIGLL